ncbi:TetR/AcrR family transcriptional regulator [Leptospira kanakyensis]|uniref:TetR/AcrR family transcriptional regulator n=1 Tax=Leptospira kanakyensis TaxID=2484968 RepID=A0A6N4Q9G5_9LEPT|nr:TetR/AcrR family transcriptional regulator [Leptospira kanakyensis]MCW7468067.1 TetR/AcrR family transcriptional regulator [Leptospira kanakyensis]TGK49297.1 TetR/AcrR family transcriptional regulator [Leptospira kanakyensis]TGK60462.1 TetR/AcrR family transcriptional regulator [Leptospira kanakyensis]TGK67860.1 TetR/AcrR family transcriptional regulator [Leptospira kanakyensis]
METMIMRMPLRERKKQAIQTSVLQAAKQLFREKGYAAVTVSEIADYADISVKTLFTYFRSKEDLAFQDEILFCNELIKYLLGRREEDSIFEAFKQFLWNLIQSIDPEELVDSLPGFHPWMDSPELEQRYLLLWEHYELRLADALQLERGTTEFNPVLRVVAGQMVSVLRILGSKAFKEYLKPIPIALRHRALEKWLLGSLEMVSGIQGYSQLMKVH